MKKSILILALNLFLITTIFSQSSGKIGGVDDPARIGGVRIDSVKSLSGFSNGFTTVQDIDGNVYKTVKIGNQWWMVENLKTTHEADGTAIPLVTDNNEWANLGDNDTDKAYCYYNNSTDSLVKYGALYTYAAAKDACPDGWHLPSDAEWTELVNYIANDGHSDIEGIALKSTTGWYNNSNGTDNYGFSALPGGLRRCYNGAFDLVGKYGYWWSSTEYQSSYAYFRSLYYNNSIVGRNNDYKSYGYSVRCVRD